MTTRIALCLVLAFLASTSPALAQSLDLGAHVVGAPWSEFDGTDFGAGGRLTWRPTPLIGLEGEVTWFPSEFPGGNIAFSSDRLEAVAALTAGPRIDRIRPFARIGAGLLRSSPAPRPFACIAIFPPPLHCLLAAGDTMPTIEIGGGLEFSTSARTFLRVDAVDRILRYPGPTFGPADEVSENGFFGHALKFTFGGGWRF